MVKSLDQNVENTVEKAKVEVYAYMQGAVARAGLAALGVVAPLQLSSGGDSDG